MSGEGLGPHMVPEASMKPSELLRRAKERCLGGELWDFDAAMVTGAGNRVVMEAYRLFNEAARGEEILRDAQLSGAFDRAIALAEAEEKHG